MEKVLKMMLPFVYIMCIVLVIIMSADYFNECQKQKNRLLTIGNTLEVDAVGMSIKLELNDHNKDENVIYEVADETIVKVDTSGNLVSVNEGYTTVTITNQDRTKVQTVIVGVGKETIEEVIKNEEKVEQLIRENEEELKVPVDTQENYVVNVTGISLNSDSSTVYIDDVKTINLTAEIKPSNATNKNVIWSSSDTNVATVSNGTVTLKNPGVVVISVKTSDGGYTAQHNLVVNKRSTTVSIIDVSIQSTNSTVYINNTKTIDLIAEIKPSNATNKNVTWSSSDTNVATVSNGTVTLKNPGVVTISVKTSDGNKSSSITLTVKKRIVFIIGASQVARMSDEWYNKNSYTSKYNYNTSEGTLVYVYKSGSGIDWQTNEGWKILSENVKKYQNVKSQVEIFVYFPLVGNSIQYFVCGNESTSDSLGKISSTNGKMLEYAKNYNASIQQLKSSGYNAKGYVVSMHPVRVSQSKSSKVVVNESPDACKYGYRSNWKYYQFNIAMKSIVSSNYSSNLKYLSLFSKIMKTNNEQKNFSYKITYNTTDGVHWDSNTTHTYVNMMLDYTKEL